MEILHARWDLWSAGKGPTCSLITLCPQDILEIFFFMFNFNSFTLGKKSNCITIFDL